MDRFGDDLTELILQYLTLEDKIRLECVSKQWRRLIYNKQFVIEPVIIHKFNYDYHSHALRYKLPEREMINVVVVNNYKRKSAELVLKTLLKKCPNITKVYIRTEINLEVLSLIGRHCPNIKSLEGLPMTDYTYLTIFRRFSNKLEEVKGINRRNIKPQVVEEYLRHCPNIKQINSTNNRFLPNYDYFPKLEKIETIINRDTTFEEFKIFSEKYSKNMKILDIGLWDMTGEELKTCIECIARFENLKVLRLWIQIDGIEIKEPIDDCLSLIGQKCNKLLKLDLSIDDSVQISDRFFDVFSEFKSIEKLNIDLIFHRVLSGSVECFKHCKQLKHLEIAYYELREDFFANIASFVPKLRSLTIKTLTYHRFSDSFIKPFHSMSNIQTIKHSFIDNTKEWYFGKCLSEVMLSPKAKNVIQINDNCGLVHDIRK